MLIYDHILLEISDFSVGFQ